MAGMPIRRARRNAELHEDTMMEIEQDLATEHEEYLRKKEKAARLYERALRIDLDPLASADEIRRAHLIMARLEKDFGFRFSQFIDVVR